MNALVARAVVAAVLVALAVFAFNRFVAHEQQIGYDRAVAEMNADKLKKIAVADAIAESWKSLYQEAENARANAVQKNTQLAADNARVLSRLGGLRYDIDSLRARRMSEVTAETCTATARTFGELFGDCQARIERLAGRYGEVARAAAGHQTDAETLDKTWPENETFRP